VAEEELAEKGHGEVKFVILELSPVSYIDTSALHILEDMIKRLQRTRDPDSLDESQCQA
jgi:anti-anti-sigma regulatory factor